MNVAGSRPRGRTFIALAVVAVVLAACTGHGGGYLAPDDVVFTGKGVLGFSFSCERSSRSTSPNPPTGQLRLEVSYSDQGRSPIGSSFSIHGFADDIEPVTESAVCIGQEPPLPGNELIILGRYRLTNGSPAGFPAACRRADSSAPMCRFELIVRDNDMDRAPSSGDYFSIRLSTVTNLVTVLPDTAVFYARAGLLAHGNLTVTD